MTDRSTNRPPIQPTSQPTFPFPPSHQQHMVSHRQSRKPRTESRIGSQKDNRRIAHGLQKYSRYLFNIRLLYFCDQNPSWFSSLVFLTCICFSFYISSYLALLSPHHCSTRKWEILQCVQKILKIVSLLRGAIVAQTELTVISDINTVYGYWTYIYSYLHTD